jgi:hypothetical protein
MQFGKLSLMQDPADEQAITQPPKENDMLACSMRHKPGLMRSQRRPKA